MFFYSYDSLHTPVKYNAFLLGKFIERLWKGEDSDPPEQPPIPAAYKDLILAGHSEGGVIIRQLILDRYHRIKSSVEDANPSAADEELRTAIKSAVKDDFLLGAHLRLFAPACMGTNLSSWYGFATSLSHFVAAFTATSLVRNELRPESTVLKNLKAGTEQAHKDFREIRSFFTCPLFGVPDQIVISDSYAGEELLWDYGYDHFDVCKPDYTHKRPLEFVRK